MRNIFYATNCTSTNVEELRRARNDLVAEAADKATRVESESHVTNGNNFDWLLVMVDKIAIDIKSNSK